jgi:ABC-type nitrate/sulfonate/bicarbonate transport system substrate-binding protein
LNKEPFSYRRSAGTSGITRRSFLTKGSLGVAALALGPAALGLAEAIGAPSAAAAELTAAKSLGSMSFQLNWITNIQFAGSFIAQSKGYYTQAGVDVSLVTGGPNVSVIPVVQAGNALVGVVDPPTSSAANAKGADIVIVGAVYQQSPLCVISLTSAPITKPAELLGKKVGIGATSVSIMKAFMAANKLDYTKMDVIPIQFDPTPLAEHQVDAYVGFSDNEAVTLELQGHPVHIMLLADFGLPSYSENYGVQKSSLQDPAKRAMIKAFLTAEIRGWQDVLANPAPAVTLVDDKYGKALDLEPKEQSLEAVAQNKLVTSAATKAHGLFWMSESDIEANLKVLTLTGAPATAALFDNSLLAEIYGGKNHL